jgi:tetratricopeptide (TPR) repeat protein
LVAGNDWDFAWVHYDAIDRFGHAFMRFHPPRMRGVRERSFALYHDVMTMVYRFADMQLGRLVELAGEGATVIVCSAHGFRSGASRPKPAIEGRANVSWHRPLGVLAMRGRAIRRDQWLWGGTVLDVCPTILALFGRQASDEFDRQVLEEALIAPSRQGAPPPEPTTNRSSDLSLSEIETELMIRQLVDDGYLEPNVPRGGDLIRRTGDARAFNLAQVHLNAGRVTQAADVLESLVARRPEIGRFTLQLAQCRLALGDLIGCAELVDRLAQLDVPDTYRRRLQAELFRAAGDFPRALEELFSVEQSYPDTPGVHSQIGDVYLAMQRWNEAYRAYQKQRQRDPDDPSALFGLGCVAEVLTNFEEAADCYLKVVTINRCHPEAHFRLGRVLSELGRTDDAVAALNRSLAQRPGDSRVFELLEKLSCRAQ